MTFCGDLGGASSKTGNYFEEGQELSSRGIFRPHFSSAVVYKQKDNILTVALRRDLTASLQSQSNFFNMISRPAVARTISPSAISVP